MDKPIDSSQLVSLFFSDGLKLLKFLRYPATDQVLEWMKELDGYNIPDISPTTDGSCVNDTGA